MAFFEPIWQQKTLGLVVGAAKNSWQPKHDFNRFCRFYKPRNRLQQAAFDRQCERYKRDDNDN